MFDEKHNLFPIRELSELTQVNSVTIRAWERRYGLLKPKRTAKGHRLYSQEDVKKIKNILGFIAKGVPVSKVKALLEDTEVSIQNTSDEWLLLSQRLQQTLDKGAISAIRESLKDIFLNYPIDLCRKQVIQPLMNQLTTSPQALAEIALLQSSLVEYALLRLSTKTKKGAHQKVLLVCGQHSALWQLALTAMELNDAKYEVTFINQACHIDTWAALARKHPDSRCIVFQEGIWKARETEQIKQLLANHPNIMLCGTAVLVADIEPTRRLATPEKILDYLCHQLPINQ